MSSIIDSDPFKYLAIAAMLLAILFGYVRGRARHSPNGASRAWTEVPLIAFAIASLGPSLVAIMIYLGHRSGWLPPPPSGYRFSTFITGLPLDFAVINWPFVVVYLACRLWPGAARSAMWLAVIAMSLPNIPLFALAPTMVSTAFDAGQGIGIIEAVVMFPLIAMIWPGSFPDLFAAGFGLGTIVAALTAPIPLLGLTGWAIGQWIGSTGSDPRPRASMLS